MILIGSQMLACGLHQHTNGLCTIRFAPCVVIDDSHGQCGITCGLCLNKESLYERWRCMKSHHVGAMLCVKVTLHALQFVFRIRRGYLPRCCSRQIKLARGDDPQAMLQQSRCLDRKGYPPQHGCCSTGGLLPHLAASLYITNPEHYLGTPELTPDRPDNFQDL